MRVEVECYSVLGSSLKQGIASIWQNPNGQIERPFGDHGDEPISRQVIQTKDIVPKRKGTLVAVYPPRLKVDGEVIHPDLNFWVGAESLNRNAWRRSKNCNGLPRKQWQNNRYEIFLLFEGEKLALCDSKMRMAQVTIQKGGPILKSASPIEVVQYVHQAGLKQASHRGVEWAIRNIELVGEYHQIQVDGYLRELQNLQSRTSLKVS